MLALSGKLFHHCINIPTLGAVDAAHCSHLPSPSGLWVPWGQNTQDPLTDIIPALHGGQGLGTDGVGRLTEAAWLT